MTAPIKPARIRNVVLVGPRHSGKTTLVEQLALATGALTRPGSVEKVTTLWDTEDALSLVSLEWQGVHINLLDTPGEADVASEARAGLRAADAALFVVSADEGVDAATAMLWDECAAVSMPRAIVVTKADRDRADVEATVEECQLALGSDGGVLPVHLPVLSDDEQVAGIIDLVSQRILDYSDGVRVEREPDPQHVDFIADARAALLVAIIAGTEDDVLVSSFLGGGEIPAESLAASLDRAVAQGQIHPVVVTATTPRGFGSLELLQVITRGFPSPLESPLPVVTASDGSPRVPLTCEPTGPLCVEVVRTSDDADGGRVSLVRVYSGTLHADATVHVAGYGRRDQAGVGITRDERAGGIVSGHTPVTALGAGDIGLVTGLPHVVVGDTLSSRELPLLLEPPGSPADEGQGLDAT
ncbi:MAG: GTP-binding protein [Candidatus Nanopelagicales bacterium]